jgi:hypothetical protein
MYCFYNNNSKPYIDTPASYTYWYFHNTSPNCYTGIKAEVSASKEIMIGPNPITSESQLLLNEQFSYSISICNSLGQIVISTNVQNQKNYAVGKYLEVSGLYYYRICDITNGETYTGKIVVQN